MLLNYEQCQEIVKNNPNFYEKVLEIDGYKVSIFDYIVSAYDIFNQPIANNPSLKAFEIRGLTFVHDHNSNEIIRFLHLTKFFNANENPAYQIEELKKEIILRVQEKLDGSMIRFFQLPNQNIYAKTRGGHTNEQSEMSMEWYKANPKAQEFIKESFVLKLAPIFELTSPFNKIVCDYSKTECSLLQLRDENTGEYLDIYNHPLVMKYKNDISISKSFPLMTFDELLAYKKTAENTEGLIATTPNKLIKWKTDWYMARFRVRSALEMEDSLIALILDSQLDDAVALLSDDNPYKIMAYDVQKILLEKLLDAKKQTLELFDLFVKKYNRNEKDFAINNKHDKHFTFAANFLKHEQIDESILVDKLKKHIKFKTRRLKMAQFFLKELGFKKPSNLPYNDS